MWRSQNSFQLEVWLLYSFRSRIWRRHSASAAAVSPAIMPKAWRRPSHVPRSKGPEEGAPARGLGIGNFGFMISEKLCPLFHANKRVNDEKAGKVCLLDSMMHPRPAKTFGAESRNSATWCSILSSH